MFTSPSDVSDSGKKLVSEALIASVANGLDFYSMAKTAHWNVKGTLFLPLHAAFESLAGDLSSTTDMLAERAVQLGATIPGTVKEAAKASTLSEYDVKLVKDLEHVKALRTRLDEYLKGLRRILKVAEYNADPVTSNMIQGIIETFEKHGWFLGSVIA